MNQKLGNGDKRTSAFRGFLMYSASAILHASRALSRERLGLTSLEDHFLDVSLILKRIFELMSRCKNNSSKTMRGSRENFTSSSKQK
jgi:hypothetical protein